MAKKSMVEREKKRTRLRQKYEAKRAELKEQFRTAEDFEEKLAIHQKLQERPADREDTIAILVYPATFYGNGPTKVFYPVWSSLAGK
jgi:hypothetical protein